MKHKKGMACLVGLFIFACGVIFFLGTGLIGVRSYLDTPRLISDFSFSEQQIDRYQNSPSQKDFIEIHGYPTGFQILFYQDKNIDGDLVDIRYEEWYYPERGKLVVFENGEYLFENAISRQDVGDSIAYEPEMFTAYMSREALSQAADLDNWMIVPVEDELVKDAQIYYADGLAFGIQNGRLVYVEAFSNLE